MRPLLCPSVASVLPQLFTVQIFTQLLFLQGPSKNLKHTVFLPGSLSTLRAWSASTWVRHCNWKLKWQLNTFDFLKEPVMWSYQIEYFEILWRSSDQEAVGPSRPSCCSQLSRRRGGLKIRRPKAQWSFWSSSWSTSCGPRWVERCAARARTLASCPEKQRLSALEVNKD